MADDTDLKRTEKLQLMLDEQELKVIDDWRFAHRMPTRAAAIRELLRRGLLAKGFDEPETNAPSTEFRVIDEAPEDEASSNA
ncbi:MAG: hypothetical protein ACFB6R_04160 [Alphaproteobacteria bacterium]